MTNIQAANDIQVDFSRSRQQMLVIETVRVCFLLAVLFIAIGFQALQPEFVNVDVLIPVYSLLSAALFLNAGFLLFFERALKSLSTIAFLFFFEAIFITALIYYTGVSQSIFLFLYLVNIILCGFVFQRTGAVFLALWTSILFSLLMIIGPGVEGQTLFFAVGLNNLAFFSVAALSGILSEQLNFMGTRLQAAGKDLRAQKNLNAIIIDNISTGLMTIDENGIVLQANRASLEILDPIPRQLVGREVDECIPGLRQLMLTQLSEIRDGIKYQKFDLSYQSPVAEKLILEIAASPLPTDSLISGWIITFQDLTRVRRLEFQMRQSEKMAAVGSLAAGIAHEIRNPLASISGSIQLLGSSFSSRQEDEQRLMKIVLREIDRLNNLITEFLDFVRPDTMKDDPVDLNALLSEIAEMVTMNKSLKSGTKQILDLRSASQISGHRDKLKQAFLNIVINAYQAMNDSPQPEIVIQTFDEDGKVVVKVKDRGCGMDEIGLRKLFEPFHTTKPKGTGLGMAVTHKIIDNHAGKIFVESAKGVGTEFTIEFPTKDVRRIDKNALADSERASENFSIAFRGQKRGNG